MYIIAAQGQGGTGLPLKMEVSLYDENGKQSMTVIASPKIPDKYIGVRNLNKFILSQSAFNRFHKAHCSSDFDQIQLIISQVTDLREPTTPDAIILKGLLGI